MISTPRGEGASLKTLGGEQAQGARKVTRRAKGKNPTLSEYLGSFAELLKSFSPTNASRSILFKAGEGTNLGGKEPLVRGADSSLQEKGRSPSSRQKLPLAGGRNHPQDSRTVRSFGLEKMQGELSSLLKSKEGVNIPLPPEGRGETAPKGDVTVKGEGKARKTAFKWMEEQAPKKGVKPYPVFTLSHSGEEGKNRTIPSNLSGGKVQTPEDTKTIQGKERLDKLLKAKMVQPASPEPPLEGEKPKIDPPLPTIQLRLDVSGDFRKVLEEGFSPRGSSGVGRETVLQQLQEKANPQIVQQAQLFLKNQEDGEIRLILKPQQLGEVRIKLHLKDRLIEGQITVENSTVKELFDQNREALAHAFREQGFEMSQLEVSVGNDPRQKKSEDDPAVSHRMKATQIASQVPSVERGWMDAHRLIDYYA